VRLGRFAALPGPLHPHVGELSPARLVDAHLIGHRPSVAGLLLNKAAPGCEHCDGTGNDSGGEKADGEAVASGHAPSLLTGHLMIVPRAVPSSAATG
jgi:hypothetical protein